MDPLIEAGSTVRNFTLLGFNWLEQVGLLTTFVVLAYQIPQLMRNIYALWIAPYFHLYTDLTKMGKWAVVTGATDGLGKAYVEELARLGLNVVLISRTKSKLESVAADIEKEFKVQTRIISADFSKGKEIYPEIRKELEGLEIGTLVNNVGMWYPFAEFFMDLPNGDEYSQGMINCNVLSVVMMTRLVLPQMCERGKGVIVNVGSLSAVMPMPLMSLYSATKAFLDNFSQGIEIEYAGKGIIVQTVLPAYVATKMSRISKPSWTSPSPTDYAQKALKTIGVERRTAVHWSHRLTMKAFELYRYLIPHFSPSQTLRVTLHLRNSSKRRKELRNGDNKKTH